MNEDAKTIVDVCDQLTIDEDFADINHYYKLIKILLNLISKYIHLIFKIILLNLNF